MQGEYKSTFREHTIEWNDEKVSRLWDYYSRTPPFSDVYFSKVFGHHMLRHSGLPLEASLEVLDFGCGPGFIWDHLLKLHSNWLYSGLDFSSASIDKVLEKAHGQKNLRTVQLVNSLPTALPAGHYDVVLLFEVAEHLNDRYLDGTLAEVSRVLKTGGVVVITTPNEEDLANCTKMCPDCGAIFHEWQHVRSWSIKTLNDRLKQHGFALRVAKAIDFSAQGLSPSAFIKRAKTAVRQLLNRGQRAPHLIAVYQKL